jgi:hypothetical protein
MLPRMLPNDNFTKRSCAKNNHNSLILLAVPRGVEPPTFGLGNHQTVNRIYAEGYSNAKIVDRQKT